MILGCLKSTLDKISSSLLYCSTSENSYGVNDWVENKIGIFVGLKKIEHRIITLLKN